MKANASNVLSYPNVECESTFDNQSPDIKYATMTLEEFVAMPCIAFQRDVEQRSKRVAKLLKKKWLPTHGDVDAVVYPDGRHERINGNTRAYLWVDDDYDGPIPSHVQLTLYSVENEEEAKELYYTLDSQEAVERQANGLFPSVKFGLQHNTPRSRGHCKVIGICFMEPTDAAGRGWLPLKHSSARRFRSSG